MLKNYPGHCCPMLSDEQNRHILMGNRCLREAMTWIYDDEPTSRFNMALNATEAQKPDN